MGFDNKEELPMLLTQAPASERVRTAKKVGMSIVFCPTEPLKM